MDHKKLYTKIKDILSEYKKVADPKRYTKKSSSLGNGNLRKSVTDTNSHVHMKNRYEVTEEKDDASQGKGTHMLVTFADYDPFAGEKKATKEKTKKASKATDAKSELPSGDTTKIDFDPDQKSITGY